VNIDMMDLVMTRCNYSYKYVSVLIDRTHVEQLLSVIAIYLVFFIPSHLYICPRV
jgi:hypothetical protein